MSTTALSVENQKIFDALTTAIDRLRAVYGSRSRDAEAKDIRSILYDIAADTMMPLPAAVQALMPQNSRAIISDARMSELLNALINHRQSLR